MLVGTLCGNFARFSMELKQGSVRLKLGLEDPPSPTPALAAVVSAEPMEAQMPDAAVSPQSPSLATQGSWADDADEDNEDEALPTVSDLREKLNQQAAKRKSQVSPPASSHPSSVLRCTLFSIPGQASMKLDSFRSEFFDFAQLAGQSPEQVIEFILLQLQVCTPGLFTPCPCCLGHHRAT